MHRERWSAAFARAVGLRCDAHVTSTPIERESETAPTIAWIERSASVPMKPFDSDDFLMSSGTTTSKCASIFGPILTKSSLKQITAFFESVERSESANSFSRSSVGWSCAERVDDASWGPPSPHELTRRRS